VDTTVNTAELFAGYLNGNMLFMPIEDTGLHPDMDEQALTFGKTCADTGYYPRRFPTHRDFLDQHFYYEWLQGVLQA
jgi:hypothetical protein